MISKKILFSLILLLSTFLGAVGQLFFKLGLNATSLIAFSCLLVIGLIAYLASTIFYFYVLSRMHLSWVYSFGGLAYIFASFLALFVLNEFISPLRWLGIGIIALGTVLIGIS